MYHHHCRFRYENYYPANTK